MFTDLLILFISAFGAATLLPLASEVTLLAMLSRHPEAWSALWLVATLGNTLGSAVNWALGRYLLHFQDRKWFPFKANQLARATRWFTRWGKWSLLLSWLPIVGDPLTFVAGVMRLRFSLFWWLVLIGKGLRYLVVIQLALAV